MVEVTGARGGEALNAYLEKLARKVSRPGTLRVGFLENATYEDGTPVAEVAAIQNFGAPGAGIPPRPFFTNLVRENSMRWGGILAGLLKDNDWDAPRALALMGEGIAGELRKSIIDTLAPPLSPVTLMLRKMRRDDPNLSVTAATVGEAAARVRAGEEHGLSGTAAKPLVDTGHMLASVDSEVTA